MRPMHYPAAFSSTALPSTAGKLHVECSPTLELGERARLGRHKVRCNLWRSRCKVLAMSLRYQIVLHKSEEGYAVNCPALPGCWSQGETEQEAMQNIREAIEDYLAAVKESMRGSDVREVEVSV